MNEISKIKEILSVPSSKRTRFKVHLLGKLIKEQNIFRKLREKEESGQLYRDCCQYLTLEEFVPGETIINYGERGNKFYIILEGSVSIHVPILRRAPIDKSKHSFLLHAGYTGKPSKFTTSATDNKAMRFSAWMPTRITEKSNHDPGKGPVLSEEDRMILETVLQDPNATEFDIEVMTEVGE